MACRPLWRHRDRFPAIRRLMNARLFIPILMMAPLASGFTAWKIPLAPCARAQVRLWRTLETSAPTLGRPICFNPRDSWVTGNHRGPKVGIRMMHEDPEGTSAMTQGIGPVLKLRALYISWFMINWTDRMWEFSVPFFLLTMDNIDSMRFALIYGASVKITGPPKQPKTRISEDSTLAHHRIP